MLDRRRIKCLDLSVVSQFEFWKAVEFGKDAERDILIPVFFRGEVE